MISEEKSSVTLENIDNNNYNNELVVVFKCEPEDMLDSFQLTAKALSFELIERESSYATAVKKIQKKKGIMSFVNCLAWFESDQFTAVKIVLSKQSKKGTIHSNYVAEVRGLVGIQSDIKQFINQYRLDIAKLGINSTVQKIVLAEPDELQLDQFQNENPYYLEACSHHITNKLILNDNYSINSSLQQMITDFQNNFRNVQECISLLPLPMKNIITIVSQVNEQLQKLLIELKYPKEIIPFSRISLENYVFSKFERQIYTIYRVKNLQTEKKFQDKRAQILQSYTIKQILIEVCLHKKFWSVNTQKYEQQLPFKQTKQQIHFNTACKQFEKIVFTNSPREKIKYCQLAYTELKNHFYDFSNKKYQLASMEDIIPVLIVVVLFLEIAQLRSEFDIMLDFTNFDPNEMEAEKRLLINLSESYNYIYRDWILK